MYTYRSIYSQQTCARPTPKHHRNACACSFHIFAYAPSCFSSASCVPASTTTESFMYLRQVGVSPPPPRRSEDDSQDQVGVPRQVPEPVRREQHRLAAAQLAEPVEQVCAQVSTRRSRRPAGEERGAPCSATGSSAALGSSKSSSPTPVSSATTERMNVRALQRPHRVSRLSRARRDQSGTAHTAMRCIWPPLRLAAPPSLRMPPASRSAS